MKLKKTLYTLPLKKNPLSLKERKGIIVEMTKDGKKGFGEIAPLPGFSKETLEEVLIDEEVLFPSTHFGIESAEIDLDPPVLTDVSYSPLIVGLDEIDRISEKQGTYKVKVGHLKMEQAIQTLKKIKEHAPQIALRIDANRRWSLKEALHFSKHFSKRDFAYLEEPVKTFDDLAKFSHETRFPIAVDESFYEKPLNEICKLPSIVAIVIKPTLFGGISRIRSLQKKIRAIDIVLSSAFESGIGTLAIARIAQILRLQRPIGIDTLRFFEKEKL